MRQNTVGADETKQVHDQLIGLVLAQFDRVHVAGRERDRGAHGEVRHFAGRVARMPHGRAIRTEGLEQAKSTSTDLILMDMSLPVIDGWEATRRLKADDETKGVPIIALTAHAMSTDREKAMEAGCDEYETKPVELPRLLAAIEKLLPGG